MAISACPGHFQTYLPDPERPAVAKIRQTTDKIGTFQQLEFIAFAANGDQIGIGRYRDEAVTRVDPPCPVLGNQALQRPIDLRGCDLWQPLRYLIGTNGPGALQQDFLDLLVDSKGFPSFQFRPPGATAHRVRRLQLERWARATELAPNRVKMTSAW